MTFQAPFWLFLLVPLSLSLWVWRPPTRLLLGVRGLSLLLIVLSLAGLAFRLPSRAGTVVVVADRSLSMPDGSGVLVKQDIETIRRHMHGDDRLAVVSFGEKAAVELAPGHGHFTNFAHEVGGSASSLAEAVEMATSLVPADTPGRLILFSDGKWTGRDPVPLASQAVARNLAIDYRHLDRAPAGDLAVARVDAPTIVSVGESYLITGWVVSPTKQNVEFALKRGDEVLSRGVRELTAGMNRLTFRDRATAIGNQGYTLVVNAAATKGEKADADPVPENNAAKFLVGVSGPRPLLHLSTNKDSGLAKLLSAGGLDVRVGDPDKFRWNLEDLSRFSAVVLENVPADKIGMNGMETLAAWVKETGGGLFMTGGQSSYAPGGYYKSPLDPALPVSMELRNEHRKLQLSIVVALDRSGSMAVPVAGGKQKMDLANLGTAQVVDLLGPQDEFGCFAVDEKAHVITPLQRLTDKAGVRRQVLKINSQGGGIFIYNALAASADALLKAKSGTKHIILFADAADSEEPGDYRNLLAKMQKAGITVSVIGLGTDRDKDAELLKDVAKLGKGRIFFSDKAEELPRLFAQDTFVVARNTFLDSPVPLKNHPGLSTLMDRNLPQPTGLKVGGYNLTYIREGAQLATTAVDEYNAPLAASWRYGAGRVVCYTGEADGKFAGTLPKWEHVGDYFTSMARWAAGAVNPLRDNMLLTQEVRDGVNRVELHLDPERKGESFAGLPTANVLRALPEAVPDSVKKPLRWTGADTLALDVPLAGNETSITTVQIPGFDAVPLPPVCLPYSPEFRPAEKDRGLVTLEKLGRATGGQERVEMDKVWQDLPRAPRYLGVARWLLLAGVVLLLVEVLERRTSLVSGLFRKKRREEEFSLDGGDEPRPTATARAKPQAAPAKATKAPLAAPKPAEKKPEAAPAAATTVPEAAETESITDAIRKARRKLKGRE